MLTAGDEYPIHQTPEPVAYSGSDRNFYDRYFYNGYSADGSVFFAAAMGVYPHLNVIDASFSVLRDGKQSSLFFSRPLNMERMDTFVGGFSVEVLEPLKRIRLQVKETEGIAFDGDGNMYVVEDVDEGRVVKKVAGSSATSGTTLAGGLDAPEDIIWVDNGGDGTLYLTESNLEHAIAISSTVPAEYRTHVTEVSLSGVVTRLLTTTADINLVFNFPNPPSVDATFWSYTSLTANGSNLLYVANELSGKQLSGSYSGVPYTADSTEAIFVVDPTAATPSATAFTNGADDAIAPEGVNFGDGDAFPLYVAEEDISNDDSGVGRLSQIDATGNRTDFCTGFSTVEDVVFDENGWLYVSEDGNGTVIQIRPDSPPDPAPDDEFVWLPILIR